MYNLIGEKEAHAIIQTLTVESIGNDFHYRNITSFGHGQQEHLAAEEGKGITSMCLWDK